MWDLRIFIRRGVNEIHRRRDLFVPEHPVIAAMERWGSLEKPGRRYRKCIAAECRGRHTEHAGIAVGDVGVPGGVPKGTDPSLRSG